VYLAVQDLVSDVKKITGKELIISGKKIKNSGTVFIQTKTDSGKWESYSVESKDGNLYITGSDARGTMFGIYHFIENLCLQYLGDANNALTIVSQVSEKYCNGKWAEWYRGERILNISYSLAKTQELLQSVKEIQTRQ
jgi:hypothetical protein